MPTLSAPPPAVRTRQRPDPLPPPPGLPAPATGFVGRTLADYVQCFALDLSALRKRDVLDVAAGASSFAAEACARGIDAVAVDPHYLDTPDELAARIAQDDAHLAAQLRLRRLPAKRLSAIAAAEADRRLAAQRFLADFAAKRFHGRYVGASLPRLPFFDATFDLVLCAHLLFSEAQQFDLDWHLAACRELMRVSAGEARLHPVIGSDGRPHPGLARLRRELKAVGLVSELVRVDGEFLVGNETRFVLKRASP